jgi:hypothetical protein
MHRLELDHLFTFVEPEFVGSPECAAVVEFGLNLEFGRVHHGQGTANRLALFPDSSLEFLWLADRGEAQRNRLRLDRRADARASGGSPFGVCLRGRLDPALREAWFWSYELPGTALNSIAIARVSDDLRWPMLFVFDTSIDTRPRSLGYPTGLFEHPNGATGIARARLGSIGDFAAALGPVAGLLPERLELACGDLHRLELELHATGRGRVEVGPLLLSHQ